MTSPNPVWLLDIDGVLSAICRTVKVPSHIWPKHQWIDTEAYSRVTDRTWRIVAATPVVDFINTVHAQGLAEIRWHTTWQDSAANVAEALGLPNFPTHEAPEYTDDTWQRGHGEGEIWWKVPSVFRLAIAEKRPIVWTDDDLFGGTTQTQRESLQSKAPFLMVAPDTYTGLTRKHLQHIREFLELHRERQHARAHEGEPVAPQGDPG